MTSLACGPSHEVFDVYGSLPVPSALESTLVDIDVHALAHVADVRDRAGLKPVLFVTLDAVDIGARAGQHRHRRRGRLHGLSGKRLTRLASAWHQGG